MQHYLALLWNRYDANADQEAVRLTTLLKRSGRGWTSAFQTDGLIVFAQLFDGANFRAYILPSAGGVILGRLFPRIVDEGSWSAPVVISEKQATTFHATGGHQLLEDYWGGYIAFLCGRSSAWRFVIRDCSGRLPCFRRRFHGVQLVFSDIEDLDDLQLSPPTVDWNYLSAFIYFNHLQIRKTGLNEVIELLAGECLSMCPNQERQYCLWSPKTVSESGRVYEYDAACASLHNVTKSCVHAWASVHKRILHSLSGGFDSAVVLSQLISAPSKPELTCINRYNMAPGEDERPYAQAAAEKAGIRLIQAAWTAGERALDHRVLCTPRAAKPSVPVLFGMLDVMYKNQLAGLLKASAISTGQGGDHLFLSTHSVIGAPDFLHDHGIRFGFLRAVSDSARVSKSSFAAVLRSALASRYISSSWTPDALACRTAFYVTPESLPRNLHEYVMHPWNFETELLSPGRRLQAFLLGELVNRHRPIGDLDNPEEVHPLISQPLMELSLRVPSYLLLRGGRRRAMARDAFKDEVPRQILDREDKGSITSFILRVIRDATPFLRELLLDGVLVRERIVGTRELNLFFDELQPIRMEQIFPLLACVTAEIWARSWVTPVPRALDVSAHLP